MRLLNRTTHLDFFIPNYESEIDFALAISDVRAGFPSPAEDYMEIRLDLNQFVTKNPDSTFFARVKGDSMEDEDFHEGDMLVIDKSLEPKSGDIVVCSIDGEFTVKTFEKHENHAYLIPKNKKYQKTKVDETNDFLIWGVVTFVLKNKRR